MNKNNSQHEYALQSGDSIETVRRLICESAERLQDAADMLQRLVHNDPTIIERITSGPDALPDGVVNGLLKVAGRSLHPKLLLNRCPAYSRISNLAYATQAAILEKGSVEVVTDAASGDVIKVDLVKLEGRQLNQVLSRAGVRSRDEQRAWLKSKETARATERVVGPAYQIKRDKLVLLRPCELSKVEILRLLEEMVA